MPSTHRIASGWLVAWSRVGQACTSDRVIAFLANYSAELLLLLHIASGVKITKGKTKKLKPLRTVVFPSLPCRVPQLVFCGSKEQ
jgi:hypothetical protein